VVNGFHALVQFHTLVSNKASLLKKGRAEKVKVE